MEIIGNETFIERTKTALTIIMRTSTKNYNFVKQHISRIFQNPTTFMYIYETPTYYVGKTADKDAMWYASCILKEAWHKSFAHKAIEHNRRGNSVAYDGKNMK